MLCDELDSSNVFIMGDYNVFSNNILYLAPRHDAQNRAWVNQLRSWSPLFYLYKLSPWIMQLILPLCRLQAAHDSTQKAKYFW